MKTKGVDVITLNNMLKIRRDRCADSSGSPGILAAVTYKDIYRSST